MYEEMIAIMLGWDIATMIGVAGSIATLGDLSIGYIESYWQELSEEKQLAIQGAALLEENQLLFSEAALDGFELFPKKIEQYEAQLIRNKELEEKVSEIVKNSIYNSAEIYDFMTDFINYLRKVGIEFDINNSSHIDMLEKALSAGVAKTMAERGDIGEGGDNETDKYMIADEIAGLVNVELILILFKKHFKKTSIFCAEPANILPTFRVKSRCLALIKTLAA